MFLDDGMVEEFLAGGSFEWTSLKHHCNQLLQLIRITVRDPLELPLQNLRVQSLHTGGPKRRILCKHLVKDTSKGPDIRFCTIGLVLPYLGTGVVGGSLYEIN